MGPASRTDAIVLRRVAYGEADWVVTLLGLDTGRVSALARSARRSARRFAGGLGIGMAGSALLRERHGADLMILESFDVRTDRHSLSTDLAKTAHMAYALELSDRLTPPRQPEKTVFRLLDSFLARLDAGAATAVRLRMFELGLLYALGLGPSLERCAVCAREDLDDDDVRWVPASGGVVCRGCSARGDLMSGFVRKTLARLSTSAFTEADTVELDRDSAGACRRAMLALLHEHVPGPLRSLDFIEKISGGSGSR